MNLLIAAACILAGAWCVFKSYTWILRRDGSVSALGVICSIPVLLIAVCLVALASLSVLGLNYTDL